MIYRAGLTGAIRNLQSNSNPSKLRVKTTTFGRVRDIIMDENHPLFPDYGEWNGLGTILVEVFDKANPGVVKSAKPYSPQSKTFPLINEIVQLFLLPVPTNSNFLREEYYYLPPYNIWNSPHHNALPNPANNELPPSQQVDYQQSEGGLVRRVTDGSTEIDLNSPSNPSQNTFVEKSNIHPLLPFVGDVLYEGRWGNSLRLGSTTKSNSEYKNRWSRSGENGDPITILRNGQSPNLNNEGWIPITEDVNQDLSSIYLTSKQTLQFNKNWEGLFKIFSPSSRPINLSNFNSSQIVVNSDRIVMNAKNDSILMSGRKTFNISVGDYMNVNSKNLYVDSENVRLGSQNATEPILLGDTTIELFNQLLQTLNNLATVLETSQTYKGGTPAPNTPLIAVASNTKQVISKIQSQLDSTKSKVSKTI